MAVIHDHQEDYVLIDAIPRDPVPVVDDFAKTVEDETIRVRIEAAINGKGAFRRFKDILLTLPRSGAAGSSFAIRRCGNGSSSGFERRHCCR